jgi:hypothetical protein
MNKSESIVNLAKALCAAQSEFTTVGKDAKNPFYKSNYAPLDSIVEAIRPVLGKHGLSFLHLPNADGNRLECVILHVSGEWISAEYPVNPVKSDPQGIGSAMSYARRYSLSAMLGIATGDDDDGEAAQGRENTEKNPKTKPAPKPNTASPNFDTAKSAERPRGNLKQCLTAIAECTSGENLASLDLNIQKREWTAEERKQINEALGAAEKRLAF